MSEAVLVTVICSCYNHKNFVAESLQSVLNQTFKNIQIIVVDDNSTDDSVKEIEKFIKKWWAGFKWKQKYAARGCQGQLVWCFQAGKGPWWFLTMRELCHCTRFLFSSR